MHKLPIVFTLIVVLVAFVLAACTTPQTEPVATATAVPGVLEAAPAAIEVINQPVETAVPPTPTTEPALPPTNTPIPGNPEVASATAPPTTMTAMTMTPTAVAAAINGIPVDQIVVLPPAVRQNVQTIFANGQTQGRSATTFSKLGDSTSMNPNFLGRFDDPANVNLGPYASLQPTIDHFSGHFSRYGVATRNGLHSWSVFDPLWADKDWCQANEDVLTCEFRLNNPSILFVRLGSNDAGSPSGYRYNMKQVVETSIANGVIPVLVTKADRFEGPDNINNTILRELAAEFNVPLLEFDIVAETLPNRGLIPNDVHMAERIAPHDFDLPDTLQSGHAVHDLIALIMLDELRQEMAQAANN